MSSQRKNQRYTAEFKEDAINLVIEHGYNCAEVGRRLGINPNNVNRWVRLYREEQEFTVQGKPSPQELQAEVQRLRKENKRLQLENEILKKAKELNVEIGFEYLNCKLKNYGTDKNI